MFPCQIEEQIGISTLEHLKQRFEQADVDGNGKLELLEFKNLLQQQLKIPNRKVGYVSCVLVLRIYLIEIHILKSIIIILSLNGWSGFLI